MQDRVLTIAREKAKAEGHNPDTYRIDVVEEAQVWKVVFSPKAERTRGGGFHIQIAKDSLSVKKVIYHQ